MRVFISWSGKESKAVAEILKDWLPLVIQSADPYVSSQDIEKGERWSTNIATHLTDIDFGIIAATPSNIDAPWINFEAGALSKSVKSRVVPLLCGMDRIDAATSPLTQFQYALATEEDMLGLLTSLNAANENSLPEIRLNASFRKWWPDFESKFKEIDFKQTKSSAKKHNDDSSSKIEAALEAILKEISQLKSRELPSTSHIIPAHLNIGSSGSSAYIRLRDVAERIRESNMSKAKPPKTEAKDPPIED